MRTETAVRTTASFFVFAYALLLLALTRCRMAHRPLPPPARQRRKPKRPIQRISTAQAISALRAARVRILLNPQAGPCRVEPDPPARCACVIAPVLLPS